MRKLLWIPLLASAAWGQSSNGYLFFAPGGQTCCGHTSMTLHVGLGGEAVLGHGVGLGAEIGAVGPRQAYLDGVVGILSPNGYYHFVHGSGIKVDPFVTGGYSLLFRSGHLNLFNFGGGLHYWFGRHLGARIELRDHVYHSGGGYGYSGETIHYWGFRFGLAIR